MEVQASNKKLTFIGQKFHALGMFLLRRKSGQEVALFVRAIASIFSQNRSFKTDTRNIILQTFFTGVEIFPILFVVATLFGTVVIIEVITLMGKVGFSDVVGGLMVVVIIRELGPILTAVAVLRLPRTSAAWSSIPKWTHLQLWASTPCATS